MKIIERELDIYEKLEVEIEKILAKGKRPDVIQMTQSEFDELYQLATLRLDSFNVHDFVNKRRFRGATIVINSTPVSTSSKKDKASS